MVLGADKDRLEFKLSEAEELIGQLAAERDSLKGEFYDGSAPKGGFCDEGLIKELAAERDSLKGGLLIWQPLLIHPPWFCFTWLRTLHLMHERRLKSLWFATRGHLAACAIGLLAKHSRQGSRAQTQHTQSGSPRLDMSAPCDPARTCRHNASYRSLGPHLPRALGPPAPRLCRAS